MKRLEKFLRPYRRESILAPLFKLLEVVFDLMVPVVVAQIIDVGVAKNDRGYIVEMFFVLLLMAAVGLLCSFTAQFFAAKASVGFATSVRQAMFDHIQRLSFTELDTLGTDTLITRLTDDVNQVQNGINMGLRLLLRSPFVVIGAMVMAFTINVRCALIFVVTVPILFVVVFSIMLISIPLFKKVQAGLDRVTGLTRENLTGVRVIRAFCREEQSVEEFEEGNRELTRLNEFVGRISALLNPLTYVLINVATVLLIARAGNTGIDQCICSELTHQNLCTDSCIDFTDSASYDYNIFSAECSLAEYHTCHLYGLFDLHIFLQFCNFFFHCADNTYHIFISSCVSRIYLCLIIDDRKMDFNRRNVWII